MSVSEAISEAGTVMPASQTGEPVLRVDGLTVMVDGEDGSRPVVSDLSFEVRRGETLALAGESGSGKSMTSLAIMGLLPKPAARLAGGRVLLGETDLARLGEAGMRRIRGDRVAMIFQEPMTSLNPVLTIGRQVIEAIQAHEPIGRRQARERAIEALNAVRIPEAESRLSQHPHELSGGMRQRVVIAMALALKPDVLIADEPTTALDVTVQAQILQLLKDLQRDLGTAIILITHDMGVVAETADRVIVLRNGKMVEENAIDVLFAKPREPYTRELLAAVPRMGTSRDRIPDAERRGAAKTLLSAHDLSVRFDLTGGVLGRVNRRVHAVEGISFDIQARETFSLVGESGCGKSTTAKAIAGLVPYEGDLILDGRNIGGLDRAGRKRVRRDIQMIFQDPFASLDSRMTVGDLVREPLDIHDVGKPRERNERVVELFERVGLTADQVRRYPHEFSGGQRQRICIARALALRPKLIVADESVSALDVSVQARVLDLLKELQAEFGIAYLFISHDMAVVETISDRVAVMYLGQIVEMGSCAQIFADPRHPYTRRLIEAVPVPDPNYERAPFIRMTGEIPTPVRKLNDPPERLTLQDVGGGHLVAEEAVRV
ncbi:ABC transporter ATP-binding protein [Pararhizobium mangrovi]|uniref:ABC transporter ATP-binding protein n=1 Tax=Pararhizobium mangrovi TaxID=2590452 RepID=A0A506U5M7_9HYPH|nr:ABC transporter ATP-binding protein [Pararhizobium mangrovi]TPW29653.1 ABC transporter ATP-binding protein [Pararhizobium mangrovi]